MTTKAELAALAEAHAVNAAELTANTEAYAHNAAVLAADAGRIEAEAVLLASAVDGLPDDEGEVEPAPELLTLVTGPFLTPGASYTADQMGGYYHDRDGEPMRFGWPNYTRPQGRGEGWCDIEALTVDTMQLTLRRAGHPLHSATTLMEQHLIFDERSPAEGPKKAVYEFEFERASDEGFRTIKLGGLVGFDGDWPGWPGGHRQGPANFSVRAILNDTWNVGPRLAAYFYLGQPGPGEHVYTGDDISTVWSNDDHTLEVVAKGSRPIAAFTVYQVRVEVDAGHVGRADGSCRLLLRVLGAREWEQVLRVDKINWAAQGRGEINRGYPLVMYGGRDESFAPQNPEQTGVVNLGAIRFAQLA